MAKFETTPVVVRVTPAERDALKQYQQDQHHISFSEAVRFALRAGLAQQGLWPPKKQLDKLAAGGIE